MDYRGARFLPAEGGLSRRGIGRELFSSMPLAERQDTKATSVAALRRPLTGAR
jgi:hypothetical protein